MGDLTTIHYLGIAAVTTLTAGMFFGTLYQHKFRAKDKSKKPAQCNPDSLMFKLRGIQAADKKTNTDLEQQYKSASELVNRYNGIISQHNKVLGIKEVIPSHSVSVTVPTEVSLEDALKTLESKLPQGSIIAPTAEVMKNTDRLYLNIEYTLKEQ